MSLVIAQDVSLAYGKKVLFDQESFTIGPHDRIALVGANGTGKSSLMKILAGAQFADSGTVTLTRKARAGYLPQDIATAPVGALLESVMSSVPGRDQLEAKLDATQKALDVTSDEEEQMELAQSLADLHEELDHFEERHGKHLAQRILKGLGFKEAWMEREVASFSGGWRMRAALAGLLLQDPDLLLLDEPTNHLDLPTLAWFDGFLKRSRKALVLISHDKDFLNRQVERVLSLEIEGLRTYVGDYDDYKRQREQEVAQLQAAAARQLEKREQLQEFITRFGAKASKASQAKSKEKQLARMEEITQLEERKKVNFSFPEAPRSGRDVLTLEGLKKSYGQNVIYDGLSGRIERGQRIAVVGENGAGKTTLLKIVAGELPTEGGSVSFGHNVVMGYYAQHHGDTLDGRSTVLEEVRALVPDKPQSYVRSVLGSFLFSGDDVDKPVGVLSGGERARVALAKLLLVPANLLVMDEPTNHLDLDSSEALIEALSRYTGTLLFVSHNRSFLNRLATQVWEVKDQKVIPYPGNLDDYLYKLQQDAAAAAGEGGQASSGSAVAAAPKSEKERKRLEAEERQRKNSVQGPLKKEIAKLEASISKTEAEQKEREAQLADPALYNDFARAKPFMDGHRKAKDELEDLYAKWEEAQAKLAASEAS